jgi:thiamine-phosphate pyrophosphorylase
LLLYYITGREQFPGTELQRREQLLRRVGEAAAGGVDYVQLRERDLSSRNLEQLARSLVETVRAASSATRVLINSRTDIALAAGADGVHLRSNDIPLADVRSIWRAAARASDPVIAVSCHTLRQVRAAKDGGANFVVFGPVFGKSGEPGVGLTTLGEACGQSVPVFALGGVTTENASACRAAGAAGIAGIRLFQEGDLPGTVNALRREA